MKIKFTMLRPDTTTEFWWLSPEAASDCGLIKDLVTSINIPHNMYKSEDELTYISEFAPELEDQWLLFMSLLKHNHPEILENRNLYMTKNSHSLTMEITNNLGNIQTTQLI